LVNGKYPTVKVSRTFIGILCCHILSVSQTQRKNKDEKNVCDYGVASISVSLVSLSRAIQIFCEVSAVRFFIL
jgi:hypothetical protein